MATMLRAATVILLCLGGGGCLGEQELRQHCVANDAGCPACSTSSDCEIVSNACQPSAVCAPKAVGLRVTQEGCSRGYPPSRARCECVARSCTVVQAR